MKFKDLHFVMLAGQIDSCDYPDYFDLDNPYNENDEDKDCWTIMALDAFSAGKLIEAGYHMAESHHYEGVWLIFDLPVMASNWLELELPKGE